jgi:hypothetical protein
VIVRPLGEQVQVVQQTDHDDLSGEFARAVRSSSLWEFWRRDSVVLACAEHDEGWRIWEEDPALDPVTGGPCNFLDVEIERHLQFYRAAIDWLVEQDPYAGLLVSLHGCGIYRGRFGLDPALGFRQLRAADEEPIRAFLFEQEALQRRITAELGADLLEIWSAYRLLEVADRFSLYFCRPRTDGTVDLGPLPGAGGEDRPLRLEPVDDWTVVLRPHPFGGEVGFDLARRLLPDRRWRSPVEFKDALAEAPLETVRVRVVAAPPATDGRERAVRRPGREQQ